MGMQAPINLVWLQLKFGYAAAMELVVGGQPFSGSELVARGIAVKAVPNGEVVAEARAYADALAENDPAAMAGVKAALRRLTGIQDFQAHITAVQQG